VDEKAKLAIVTMFFIVAETHLDEVAAVTMFFILAKT
jgi:hypothetical protein